MLVNRVIRINLSRSIRHVHAQAAANTNLQPERSYEYHRSRSEHVVVYRVAGLTACIDDLLLILKNNGYTGLQPYDGVTLSLHLC